MFAASNRPPGAGGDGRCGGLPFPPAPSTPQERGAQVSQGLGSVCSQTCSSPNPRMCSARLSSAFLVLPLVAGAVTSCDRCTGSRLPDYSLLWSLQPPHSWPSGVPGPLQKVQRCRDPPRTPATQNRLTELSLLSFLKAKKKKEKKRRNNLLGIFFPHTDAFFHFSGSKQFIKTTVYPREVAQLFVNEFVCTIFYSF